MASRPAFSLIELVMVITAIGLFAAIAIPRYANSAVRYRAGAAAQRIEADLVLAQERARLTSQDITGTFNTDNETVSIPALTGLDDRTAAYLTDLSAEPYQADITAVSFNGTDEVTFDGFGVPDEGGTVDVRAGDVTKRITLDADTGEVSIQ